MYTCRELLSIASLDGLVEASRQSRVCGGAANEVMCMVFKVLSEVRRGGAGGWGQKGNTQWSPIHCIGHCYPADLLSTSTLKRLVP
jgi:hypothetical protein